MKKVLALSLVVLCGTLSVSAAQARSILGSREADEHVAVSFLPPLSDRTSDGHGSDQYFDPTPAMVAEAQGEIRADANLRSTLLSHNVELNNVVAIGMTGNGDRIVYVR